MREICVKVRRGGAGGSGSRVQEYIVPVEEDAVVSVMTLLEYIHRHLDRSLAFFSHAACRQAACGKCTVLCCGRPVLACKEIVKENEIMLEPAGKDIIRDLVCG